MSKFKCGDPVEVREARPNRIALSGWQPAIYSRMADGTHYCWTSGTSGLATPVHSVRHLNQTQEPPEPKRPFDHITPGEFVYVTDDQQDVGNFDAMSLKVFVGEFEGFAMCLTVADYVMYDTSATPSAWKHCIGVKELHALYQADQDESKV